MGNKVDWVSMSGAQTGQTAEPQRRTWMKTFISISGLVEFGTSGAAQWGDSTCSRQETESTPRQQASTCFLWWWSSAGSVFTLAPEAEAASQSRVTPPVLSKHGDLCPPITFSQETSAALWMCLRADVCWCWVAGLQNVKWQNRIFFSRPWRHRKVSKIKSYSLSGTFPPPLNYSATNLITN